ncbi:MAG: hypothetical protein BGO39_16865 [Chloroflexi bacterium 54-19]|nr:MAG: hypothetical protein BGO39_16865 [Chloroflexi bacterium 54-19]
MLKWRKCAILSYWIEQKDWPPIVRLKFEFTLNPRSLFNPWFSLFRQLARPVFYKIKLLHIEDQK